MKNYYEILGVPESASDKVIRRKTFLKGKQLHPKSKEKSELDSLVDFVDIIEAYHVLSEEKSRKIYDKLLRGDNNSKMRSKHEDYIRIIAHRGRKYGEKYAQSKFKKFKKDHKEVQWWDITAILQDLIP